MFSFDAFMSSVSNDPRRSANRLERVYRPAETGPSPVSKTTAQIGSDVIGMGH